MDKHNHHAYFRDKETADIADMHKKFWDNVAMKPKMGHKDLMRARADFIQEELNELYQAIEQGDFLEQIDALIDIVVVVKGTAVQMGIRWGDHWNEVLRANMSKEVGQNPKRPELKHDLIKPEGWMGPDHLSVMFKGKS